MFLIRRISKKLELLPQRRFINICKNSERNIQMIEKLSKLNNLNSSINTIIFTTIIILVIVVVLGLIEILNHKIMLIISVFGITILIIAGIAGIITTNKIEKTRDISQYTLYLDGNEVDMNKIDIKLYNRSYDDENLKIFITNKTK